MSASDPHTLSVVELATAVRSGEITAVRATSAYLDRIARFDEGVGAFLHVDREGALAQAASIDAARDAGKTLGALAGVPIAIKDNLCQRELPLTCGSRILQGYVPPYEAHVVERLRASSAVLLGKLNMDEFAMGSSTENSAYFPARNPWDLSRTPGGSSGGAAVAACARLAAATLGSDTGGSVRQPAGFCGVTAIKPSYGRVSRYGLVAYASSLDQVGPVCRDVRDTARMLSVIAGHDERDATSSPRPVEDYEAECGRDVRGLRVGVMKQSAGCDAAVTQALEATLDRLRGLGCEAVSIELPNLEHSIAVYYILAPAEASSNLARFDGMRFGKRVPGEDLADTYRRSRGQGFGAEVKRRIMLGTYVLSAGYYDAFYLKAQRVRTLIRNDFTQAFERCDVVLTPTAPTPAFRLGELTDPVSVYKQDIFTLPPSLAGLPAISTPCGMAPGSLPIGAQLIGPLFEEGRLLRLAHALEQSFALDSSSALGHVPPGFA